MPRLEEIDKNFKIETKLQRENIKFYSARQMPFLVYGLIYEDGKFRRMPMDVAKSVSDGVLYLHSNTAGGRVRFKTDSSYVAISAKMENVGKMDHFAITGSGGFDMYVKKDGEERFETTFRPPFDMTSGYESLFDFKSNKLREITINFPLYSDVCELYIGLEDGAKIETPTPYRSERPIVYYGSSITQGGCASRPGNAYTSILSRWFNMDHINLGFSGNGKGEDEIADYISTLDMEIFVYDYDHNAPNAEHLLKTHERMFIKIREKNPTLPIILMSTTTLERYFDSRKRRREIIYQTYKNARARGDNNVFFWDGGKEFEPHQDYGTVEGCHPNDYGFFAIASSLKNTVKEILKEN